MISLMKLKSYKFSFYTYLLAVLLLSFLNVQNSYSQEFNARVVVNAQQVTNPNLSIFKTLETSLQEFINKNKWTEISYLAQERIPCNFFVNITEFDNSNFTATLQVQASRPVFGSGYTSPIANFNDRDFNFVYQEYEPLVFNENGTNSNLISVISYYLYTILGIDADSFSELGGTPYFQIANQIVTTAQSSGNAGWSASSGQQSRFRYNDDILSGIFRNYRIAFYNYHMKGLDILHKDVKTAKKEIIEVIDGFHIINRKRRGTYVMRSFFDAKNNEITRMFSSGPKVNITQMLSNLNAISPNYAQDWKSIENNL